MNARRVGVALVSLVLSPLLVQSSATAQSAGLQKNGRRFALVIGNKNYVRGALDNPWNDAKAMGSVLQQLGFTVALRFYLSREYMIDEIKALADRGAGAEAVLVYFSGCGARDKGRNFLLPTNVELNKSSSIPENCCLS